MTFSDVVEMSKPDPDSQYRLKTCACGGGEVVYLHCKDIFDNLAWRVKCMDCMAETARSYAIKHDAQLAWNTGQYVTKT